jgi:hypothetical protein
MGCVMCPFALLAPLGFDEAQFVTVQLESAVGGRFRRWVSAEGSRLPAPKSGQINGKYYGKAFRSSP